MTDIRITSTVDSNVDEALNEAQAAALQIESAIRRTLTYGTLTLQALGVVIDEAFRVQVELIGNAIGTTLALAATGLTAANVGRIAHVAILYLQLQALRQGRTQAATQLGAAEQILDMALLGVLPVVFVIELIPSQTLIQLIAIGLSVLQGLRFRW